MMEWSGVEWSMKVFENKLIIFFEMSLLSIPRLKGNEQTMSSSNDDCCYTQFLATWRNNNSYSEDEWEAHIELIMEVLEGDVEGVEIDQDMLSSSEYPAVYRALHGK